MMRVTTLAMPTHDHQSLLFHFSSNEGQDFQLVIEIASPHIESRININKGCGQLINAEAAKEIQLCNPPEP
ncbi:hypothetical protein [uncultured Herbaspirillum sp.]|uniref:hypothetical protein n=1 Tax=uncultured Herbaspirillum sp. TaxID=160236 RepID=UPI0026168478|nr:hypothetical protein [uncultured Herbaspirillum sp.]